MDAYVATKKTHSNYSRLFLAPAKWPNSTAIVCSTNLLNIFARTTAFCRRRAECQKGKNDVAAVTEKKEG